MADAPNAVLAAIADITGKIGSVKKGGHNAFHNYAFATAADILHKLQPMLAESGLIIVPTQKELRFLDQGQALLAIDYEFALYHKNGVAHPDKPIITGMANARNNKGGFDDKAANKCLTAAHKYFLLTLFKIPTGDYDDADADGDAPVKTNGNGHAPAPAPAPAPATGELLSPDQIKTLRLAITEVDADEPAFLAWIKAPTIEDIPVALYAKAIAALDSKRAAARRLA